jgi:hypothetical protein
MWPVYANAISDSVGRHLNEREAATIAEPLGRLADRKSELTSGRAVSGALARHPQAPSDARSLSEGCIEVTSSLGLMA